MEGMGRFTAVRQDVAEINLAGNALRLTTISTASLQAHALGTHISTVYLLDLETALSCP